MNGSGTVATGEYKGRTLREIYEEDRSICGKNGENFKEFPILIKFIDALDNLSIQVHPDEEYARRVENGAGKTECWYILDCDDDAELIMGFKEKIDAKTFRKAIEENKLTDYVKSYKVKKGDFFFIEAGTVHAICKGVLLAEVQQNSDTTYRVYDYGRVGKDGKPRELHIEKAIDVTKTEPYTAYEPSEDDVKRFNTKDRKLLASCDLFSVCTVNCSGEYKGISDENSFVSLLILTGEGSVSCDDTVLTVKKGESVFIPASAGSFTVTGNMEILETRI